MIESAGLTLLEKENWVGSLANLSAQLMLDLPEINWVGFYLWDGKVLRLGPFAGKPACTVIALGRGVCGTAAARRETLIVADVDQFPGHITCDPASKSEIVVPIYRGEELIGVLDVDSPKRARFGSAEKSILEDLVKNLVDQLFDRDAALPRAQPAFAAR